MTNRKSMTRADGRATSEKAADSVRVPTIRSRVLAWTEQQPDGFIDHDLSVIDPNAPESSLRKRRTELTDDGYIVATNSERPNRNGKMSTVFVHRKFHHAPPPITVRATQPRARALQSRKREGLMFNALVMAAAHHQGGHSEVGRAIAEALNIPFPIRVSNLPALRVL